MHRMLLLLTLILFAGTVLGCTHVQAITIDETHAPSPSAPSTPIPSHPQLVQPPQRHPSDQSQTPRPVPVQSLVRDASPTPHTLFQPVVVDHARPIPTPAPTPALDFDSPLGLAFGEGSRRLDHFMDYIHDLGVPRTKVSFYWGELEPEPGRFDFRALDTYLDQLQPQDRALVNLFTNGWCTQQEEIGSRKGAPLYTCPYNAPSCEKTCDQYYQEFVAAVAQRVLERAHGGVAYFQRDTEPASNRHFPATEPQAYVEIQHLFYTAVKAVLPEVQIIGVNHNGNFTREGQPASVDFFDYVLQHMADDYDILDIRLYEEYGTVDERVAWFRDRMARYGYQKPIVTTEYGGPDPRTLHNGSDRLFYQLTQILRRVCGGEHSPNPQCSRQWLQAHRDEVDPKLRPFFGLGSEEENALREEVHCHDITQRTLMALSTGIEATWWWNLRSPGTDPIFGQMRLMDNRFQPLPGYACFQRMTGQLAGMEQVQRMDLGDPSLYVFQIHRREGDPLYVAWHRDPSLDPFDALQAEPVSVHLPIPDRQVELTDVFGQTWNASSQDGWLTLSLSDTPIYIAPMP